MILHNPTENDITVTLGGREYTAPANGDVTVPQAAGTQWVKEVHQFMQIVSSDEVEVVAPVVAPVVEEAPLVEETPEEEALTGEEDDEEDDSAL